MRLVIVHMPYKPFRFFAVAAICLMSFPLFAQQLGFEWIRPYQSYYKFKVGKTGVYRVTSANLNTAGLNVNNVDPRKIQVFHQGKEVPVFVAGESDGAFNAGDYIELVGFKNDGKVDSILYGNPNWQPNKFVNLFTDTSVYFITILPDTSVIQPLRFTINNDYNFTGLTPEPYFTDTVVVTPTEEYLDGPDLMNANEKYIASDYEDGEGWASERVAWYNTRTILLRTPQRALIGPAPTIEYKFIGASNARPNANNVNHHVQIAISNNNTNYNLLTDQQFLGYLALKYSPAITSSLLGDPITYFRMSVINDLGVPSDFVSLSYVQLSYSRLFNLNNASEKFMFINHVQGGARSYVQLQGVGNSNQNNLLVYDLTSLRRTTSLFSNGNAQFVLSNPGRASFIYVFDSTEVMAPVDLRAVQFPNINPLENYEFLLVTHPTLNQASENYAAYRSQKYKVLKVFSEELYDYYYYGNVSPLAMRRFATHLITQQTQLPKFLLLAGRGYQNDKARFTSLSSPNPQENYNKNLVLAYGVPGADAMFTAGISDNGFYAEIPTGRVSAATNQELQNYLDKIITYEMSPDTISLWRKHTLHVSGGTRSNEQAEYKRILDNNASKLQSFYIGGKVFSFNKSVNVPSQLDLKDQLVEIQNEGVNMVSFFGHASLTILDVDIGSIGDLKNNGKYPFYYFSGCNVGNATELDPQNGGVIYAKDYLCTANKGAIGWLAHSNFSFDGFLEPILNAFYTKYAITDYGEPVGNIIRDVTKGLSNGSFITRNHNLQWILQGDPAVQLYSPGLPDYSLNVNDVFATNANLSIQNEFLDLGVVVTNLAKAVDDSITIGIKRTLPNNQVIVYPPQRFSKVYYKDTFNLRFEMLGDLALGNNRIEVTVDVANEIDEVFENNNTVSVNIFVPGNGTMLLYPTKDAVVGRDTVWLTIQSNNIFSTNNPFIIEVDTTPTFNSTVKINSGILVADALLRWPFKPMFGDSVTYYWRARLNVNEQQGGRWSEASFTWINNHPDAWMQRTFARLMDLSGGELLVVDTANQRFEFSENTAILNVYASRFRHSGRGVWYGENQNPGALNCVSNGVFAILFDQRTLQPFINPKFPLNCANVIANNQNPSLRKLYYYGFPNSTQGQADFRRFVDSVEEGTYVAVFSMYDNGNATWTNDTRLAFMNLGSSLIANINHPDIAFSMVGRKGAEIGTIAEDTILSYFPDTFTTTTAVLFGKWFTTSGKSKLIGPAKQWQTLHYQLYSKEGDGNDHNNIQVWGTLENNVDTLLLNNATNGTDLSFIDAKRFPYLKLSFTLFDTVYRTPDQFGYWMIKHQPVPEGTISIKDGFKLHNEVLEQGDSIYIKVAFQNISEQPFDSLPVKIKVIDENRVPVYAFTQNLNALNANQMRTIEKKISTYNLRGQHGIEVYFNEGPQQEITKVNNYLFKNFFVNADVRNPIMEVTFDGYKILNGDFVSPQPLIRITSKDDSKFKLQNDTSTFVLFIQTPNDNEYIPISLSSSEITFIPATNEQNKAALEYRPRFVQDGIYRLKVLAKDASNNLSGGEFYEIEFNVMQKSTITQFFPYPNPATTNVKFVFTLTGSLPPDDLLIRIMTVSGKVVKEITKAEFGPIKIGNNISEYSWDGTDNFGDRLANGVYLYQVLTRINGNAIEKRSTQADQFFVQNVGKIYLMK